MPLVWCMMLRSFFSSRGVAETLRWKIQPRPPGLSGWPLALVIPALFVARPSWRSSIWWLMCASTLVKGLSSVLTVHTEPTTAPIWSLMSGNSILKRGIPSNAPPSMDTTSYPEREKGFCFFCGMAGLIRMQLENVGWFIGGNMPCLILGLPWWRRCEWQ